MPLRAVSAGMGVSERAPILAPWAAAEALGLSASELARFQDEPPQMASGAVGKSAFLRLGFERRGDRTILADLDRRAPYTAQRALYPDPEMPDQAWLFMITTSGCVLQGDRLALDIALGPGARAHVTTQSATKIHSMDANYAAQTQSIALADGAYLELMPEPLIPHRQARFVSDTRISIAPTATLLYEEIIQPGRKHHHPDESFGATLLSIAMSAERPDGRALFSEKLVIEPVRRPVRQTGVMGSFDVLGNVILLTPREHADRVHARIEADVDLAAGVAFGACRLPNDAGLIFKALGRETEQVKAKVREFWAVAREEVTGTRIPAPFFWR
jgi:urease accessory protein